jgi:recombination protein RecA
MNKNDLALFKKVVSKQLGSDIFNFEKEAERFSTGSLKLDDFIGGGLVLGKILEVFGGESSGKSTLATLIAVSAQKHFPDKAVGILDIEHVWNHDYSVGYGLDYSDEKLIFTQPSSAEQALQLAEKMLESGLFSVVIVDSIAAMLTKRQLAGEIGDATIGEVARIMSASLPKLNMAASNTNTTLLFINQTRSNIGGFSPVPGGSCFHADTLVNFTDGRSIPIREVVENKITGNVWSYNNISGQIEEKPIINWYNNGKVSTNNDFIHIEAESVKYDSEITNGRFGFTGTPEHKILTLNGWKEIQDLTLDDYCVSKTVSIINRSLRQFVLGIVIGDSSIFIRSKNTGQLIIQDNVNLEYAKWKVEKLSSGFTFSEIEISEGKRFTSSFSYELADLKRSIENRNPLVMFNEYSNMSLALWFMDDGYSDFSNNRKGRIELSAARFKDDKEILDAICIKFNNILEGLNPIVSDNGSFLFNSEDSDKIYSAIREYVPACMQYKLPERHRGHYKDFTLDFVEEIVTVPVKILKKEFASNRMMRQKGKYDIEVADNHNYMVGGYSNGIVVHNSTTPGGKALKFFCSLRLEIKRRDFIVSGTDTVGQVIRVVVRKNKFGNNNGFSDISLRYNHGFDPYDEIVELCKNEGVIESRGAWVYYKENKWNGIKLLTEAVKNEEGLFESLYSDYVKVIKEKIKSVQIISNGEDLSSLDEDIEDE